MKDIKISLKKKKIKVKKNAREKYQNFTEEEKEKIHQYYLGVIKLLDYNRNYCLVHKK